MTKTVSKKKNISYNITCKQDITNQIIDYFKKLVNVLIIKLGVSQKMQQGDRNQIISHLSCVYPQNGQTYNQNFYYTMAYNKMLYILYKKNRHVSYDDPVVEQILNKKVDAFFDQAQQDDYMQKFIKFLGDKILGLNDRFNKPYYIIIIRKVCQLLSDRENAPKKRRLIIQQIYKSSYNNGKNIPKNYIYRVLYVLKKNYSKWKAEFKICYDGDYE